MNEADRFLRIPEKGFSIALNNASPLLEKSLSLRVALLERLRILGIEPGAAYEKVSAMVEDPTAETINEIVGREIEDQHEFIAKAWIIREIQRTTQTRLQELQRLRETSPAVQLAVDHVLPNLHNLIARGDQLEEGKEFLRRLPADIASIAQRILKDMDVDDDRHRMFREIVSRDDAAAEIKLMHWIDLLNDALEEENLKISVMNADRSMYGGDVMTLAVFQVHESSNYEVPGTDGCSINIFRASIIDPVQHVSDTLGFWDVAMGNAIVCRDRAEQLAREYRSIASGELPTRLPTFRAQTQYMCSRYDAKSMASVMESGTLCEETKHGINSIRRLAADERSDTSARDSRFAYARERLRGDGFARKVYEKLLEPSFYAVEANRPASLHVTKMLEEANVKLFEIMIGPDPHHSLYDIAGHHEAMNQTNPENIQYDEKCLALMLLNMHSGQSVPPTQLHIAAQRLLGRSAEDVRLIAKRTIMNEYTESIDENPFCAVSHDGKLIRHPGTLDMFAAWA